MRRLVSAQLYVDVFEATTLDVQVAVAPHPGAVVTEAMSVILDGLVLNVHEISGEHGNRIHRVTCGPGSLQVVYSATIDGSTFPAPITDYDLCAYLRPSRYAESDKFFGFAATEFADRATDATLLADVARWVGNRLTYVPGSSDPIDGAADTLLAGAGVCRDYSHLVIAMLRALGVPARLVAVYAPGCDPMDFHAVAEAFVEGGWHVVDATYLAPRSSLVRIATGRDAADTAFLDNHGGRIVLTSAAVSAVVDGVLPLDDIDRLVSIT